MVAPIEIKPKRPEPEAATPSAPVILTPPGAQAEATPTKPVELLESKLAEPASVTNGKPSLSIAFKSTETSVPLTVKPELDKVAKQAAGNENMRVTLIAYAASTNDQSTTARRVSLSRALAVRAYLIDQGVGNLRINVQAEGDKNPGGDPDRVDVFVRDITKKN